MGKLAREREKGRENEWQPGRAGRSSVNRRASSLESNDCGAVSEATTGTRPRSRGRTWHIYYLHEYIRISVLPCTLGRKTLVDMGMARTFRSGAHLQTDRVLQFTQTLIIGTNWHTPLARDHQPNRRDTLAPARMGPRKGVLDGRWTGQGDLAARGRSRWNATLLGHPGLKLLAKHR